MQFPQPPPDRRTLDQSKQSEKIEKAPDSNSNLKKKPEEKKKPSGTGEEALLEIMKKEIRE